MDILEKIKLLPQDKQKKVEDFVNTLFSEDVSDLEKIELAEKRRKNLGRLEGKIWMADDFNQTPTEFNEYL